MNGEPLAAIGNAELSRAVFLRGAVLVGSVVTVPALAGCDSLYKGDSPDWPTPSAGPTSMEPVGPMPEPHEDLTKSKDSSLARLGQHEKEFGYRFESNMLFVDMPRDPAEAEAKAKSLAPTLKEYAKQGVKPIVIMEPTYDGGEEMINLKTLADKDHIDGYRGTMDSYFRTLNWAGVTDEEMGRWVLFPEPNIPTWKDGVTSAKVFKQNFIPAAQALQTHFRNADISILLEQQTYPDGDEHYQHGSRDMGKLLEFVTDIPEGLVSSVGIQGYPWDRGAEAKDFVGSDQLLALSARLRVNKVWLNTGTYAKAKRDGRDVRFDPRERQYLLETELREGVLAKMAGRDVEIVIFGQDKYPEDADWSYKTPEDRAALLAMLKQAHASHIKVSFFDPVY